MGQIADQESRRGLPYPLEVEPWGDAANDGVGLDSLHFDKVKPEWLCYAYKCPEPVAVVLWWREGSKKHGYCMAHGGSIAEETGGHILGYIR